MGLAERQEGEVVVLSPTGPLSASEVSALEERLRTVDARRGSTVVLDGTQLGALSGALLRVLLLASRRQTRSGGSLVLAGLPDKLRRALSISGFDRDFELASHVGEALARAVAPRGDPAIEALAGRLQELLGRAPIPPGPARAPGALSDSLLRLLA